MFSGQKLTKNAQSINKRKNEKKVCRHVIVSGNVIVIGLIFKIFCSLYFIFLLFRRTAATLVTICIRCSLLGSLKEISSCTIQHPLPTTSLYWEPWEGHLPSENWCDVIWCDMWCQPKRLLLLLQLLWLLLQFPFSKKVMPCLYTHARWFLLWLLGMHRYGKSIQYFFAQPWIAYYY